MPRTGVEPILPAHNVARTRQFYESLGFKAGYYDDHYEILRRGELVVHLEARHDLHPARNDTVAIGGCPTRTHCIASLQPSACRATGRRR